MVHAIYIEKIYHGSELVAVGSIHGSKEKALAFLRMVASEQRSYGSIIHEDEGFCVSYQCSPEAVKVTLEMEARLVEID